MYEMIMWICDFPTVAANDGYKPEVALTMNDGVDEDIKDDLVWVSLSGEVDRDVVNRPVVDGVVWGRW